ncbi:putative alpha-actinin [Histomonas meleagridis]|nr:putative alpha-actinin [Histomonas meleagridis]
MCQEILNKVDEINQRSNSLEGTIEEQHDVINGLIAEAEEKQSHLPELQPPYNELIQLNLNNRSKFTPYAIQKEVDQLIVHLKHLLDQNKAAALQADNERRIREYNDKAQKYIDVAQDIEKELDSIEGSLPERRAAFIKQQSEIAEKREKVNEIDPDFEDLEKDGLHLGISNTPEYIKTQYGNSLKRAITETNKIFDEMVNEYDALAGKITERVRDLTNQAEAVKQPEKVLETQKAEYEELQGKAAEVEAELPTLDHPYSEIVEFKLAARIKTTPSEAASQVAQLKNLLDKLLEDNAAAIVKRENERRIKEYNELAQTYVDKSRDFAATVDAIDGTLVERRTAYLQKQKELNEKRDDLDNLTPHYQALEKDGLHMNINNTPISISSFYAQVLEKITNALNLIYDEMVKNFDEMATALNERIKKVEAEHKAIDGTLQEKKEKLAAELTEAQGIHDDVPQLNEPFAELTEFKLNYRPKFTPIDIQGYIDQLIANINHVNQINDSEIQAESNKARIDNYIGKAQAVGLENTEKQLQEYRDTFSFFDKDNTKSPEPYELKACLTALGENVEDEECNEIIKKYTGGNTSMDFDNYVKFMLDRFTKQETAETTKDAFKAVTKNAPVMTEELMNQHFTPEDVEYMKANMPQTEDGYDYSQWADSVFVE